MTIKIWIIIVKKVDIFQKGQEGTKWLLYIFSFKKSQIIKVWLPVQGTVPKGRLGLCVRKFASVLVTSQCLYKFILARALVTSQCRGRENWRRFRYAASRIPFTVFQWGQSGRRAIYHHSRTTHGRCHTVQMYFVKKSAVHRDHRAVLRMHGTLVKFTVHNSTWYGIQYTQYAVHRQCTQYSYVYCGRCVCREYRTLYMMQLRCTCTQYRHSTEHSIHSTPYTVHSTQYTATMKVHTVHS